MRSLPLSLLATVMLTCAMAQAEDEIAQPAAAAPAVDSQSQALQQRLEQSEQLRNELALLADRHPSVGDVRGAGLFIGFELVSHRESKTADKALALDVIERLRAELGPRRPLVLLLGVDAFLGLPTWRRWTELFDFAHLAVANRPGYSLGGAAMPAALAEQVSRRQAAPDTLGAAPAGRLVQFAMTPLAISATDIRARCAAGQSLRYLLPPPVVDYISRHQLYL